MIDTSRWVLVEAWLALGLRATWMPSYLSEPPGGVAWMDEEGAWASLKYYYEGDGVWRVKRPQSDGYRLPGFPDFELPSFSSDTMRHELAHYLAAKPEQRRLANFGLSNGDTDAEAAALEAEAVISAVLIGASRIAQLALARPFNGRT